MSSLCVLRDSLTKIKNKKKIIQPIVRCARPDKKMEEEFFERVRLTEQQKAELPEVYILNPESGKYVLRNSTTGRKIAKGVSTKKPKKGEGVKNPDDLVVDDKIKEISRVLYKSYKNLKKTTGISDSKIAKNVESLKLGYFPVSPMPRVWGGLGVDPDFPVKLPDFEMWRKPRFNEGYDDYVISRLYDAEFDLYIAKSRVYESGFWELFVGSRAGHNKFQKFPVDLFRMIHKMLGVTGIRFFKRELQYCTGYIFPNGVKYDDYHPTFKGNRIPKNHPLVKALNFQ